MKTTEKINPQMVILARESRGISQKELADLLDISAGKVCHVEQDAQTFSDVDFNRLCQVLKYPKSFFYQQTDAFLPTMVNFRKRLVVSQRFIMPIEAQTNIFRLNVEALANEIILPTLNIPEIKETSPIEVADKLRKLWNIPDGPIDNLTEIVESNGILIATFDFGTERVDSRTILTSGRHPIILLNKKSLGDRRRFSLAYELGHILMHLFYPVEMEREIGHEANVFAAALLMQESEIRKDFNQADINIPRLSVLKPKWKVSMQALLYRSDDLGYITYNHKRYLLSMFNQMKIRRREPIELDVPIENPNLLSNLMEGYRNEKNLSVKQMADKLYLLKDDYIDKYVAETEKQS
ncbi:MAG TPA: hypothetical protein DDX39_11980 [Bacteroidales bacterium]|nr:MAG: hypothetical protein A2W98_10355 [Bacteroidetes bacterium GWF2_33_38]OFY73017.1 MAG: hypothetical protein A2265_04860 [Bacteroidetes bacterium RIFOXYA12_FULL_33_9]HBF89350.1 hypothetical protein [Bacteroidales bacterium]